MRACWAGILIVLAAMLAAPAAWAQDPTPSPTETPTATPTPEPTPTPEEIEEAERKEALRKRKIVRRVYADYQDNGRIDNCDHTRTALKRTLESITEEFDTDFPDFREAVKAAIKAHDNERCEREREEAEATPTPSPTASPSPPTTTPTTPPAATSPPPLSTDSGDVPDFDSGGAAGGGSGNSGGTPKPPKAAPPSESDITPVQPEATPAPTVVPPTTAAPQLAVVRPDGDSNLLLPAILLAAALAGLGLLGASALAARRSGHLAGWGHSLREASYRASGAWGDFGDWLRLGR